MGFVSFKYFSIPVIPFITGPECNSDNFSRSNSSIIDTVDSVE